MTSRERVIRAIEFGEPDRMPLWPRVNGSAWTAYGDALGELLAGYPIDLGPRGPKVPAKQEKPLSWVDDWGCRWQTQRGDYFGFVVGHPLAEREALSSYEFPDYGRSDYDEQFRRQAEAFARRDMTTYALAGGATEYGVLWYRMLWLRGMENLLIDLAEGDDFVLRLRDRVLQSCVSYLERVVTLNVDGVLFGDDWGAQSALMIRPELWREVFKPAYKILFDKVREAGKHVILETDGCTRDILGDWVDIGVDLLSVELHTVGLASAAAYQGRLCFYADPDRQHVLPHGTPEQVRRHIRDIVQALWRPRGGLIGCLYIDDSVPLANVAAALDAFVELGRS